MLQTVDAVMAPYYLLERAVVLLFGDSPFAMRLPSAAFMGMSAALVSLVGTRTMRLTGLPAEGRNAKAAGFYAGLLFAAIPSISYYGQESRAYAMAVFACLLSTLALLLALEAPHTQKRWGLYCLSLVLVGLSHLVALAVLPAHAVLALIPRQAQPTRYRLIRSWLVSTAVSGLILLPFVLWSASQKGQVSWIPGRWSDLRVLPKTLFQAGAVGYLLLSTAMLSGIPLARTFSRARCALLLWAFLPPAVLFATRNQLHLFLHRYMLFIIPAHCVLSATSCTDLASWLRARNLPHRAIGIVFCCGVLLMGSSSQVRLRRTTSSGHEDYLAATQYVLKMQHGGDGIAFGALHRPPASRLAFDYFSRNATEKPRDVFRDTSASAALAAEGCSITATCLAPDLSRLWLLTTAQPSAPWGALPFDRTAALQDEFQVASAQPFQRVTVVLLTRRPP